MKIGVDARMMYGAWQYRGIGRYTKSILAFLPQEEILAFLPERQHVDSYRCVSEGHRFFPWWEQRVLPKLAAKENLTYLLCPSITSPVGKIPNTKKIVVVYDLIFMQSFSDLPVSHSIYNNMGRLYRRYVAPKAYSTADILISISHYTKLELCNRFQIAKEKVHVIPCSITNDWFIKEPVPATERKRYLLTVSGDSPSKNLIRLFEAFAIVIKESAYSDFKLRIVGVIASSRSFFYNKLKELNISENVVFEDFVNNDQLKVLYQEAWASLTLSLYEGFGIPIVEALASGAPVVCSNTTSMPEVAGDAAIYANPRDINSIASGILKIISLSPGERTTIALYGMKRARIFSEDVVSRQIMDFWSGII